ncbi:MAG: AIR synthase-related protein, partial [Gemmatimonadaceae bacterium]
NENPHGAVYPTPTIGMVGLIDDIAHITRAVFTTPGHAIVLLGEPTSELGGSEYLARVHGRVAGAPPACDLDAERRLIEALLEAIRAGDVASAHDCSEGGLAVALAESCMMLPNAATGADIDLSRWSAIPARALLFGEAQGRVVVSTASAERVIAAAERHGVSATTIGNVRSVDAGFTIRLNSGVLNGSVASLADAYHQAIPRIMTRVASAVLDDDLLPVGT